MPRKRKSPGSGGARQGKPGVAYGQRTDMNRSTQPITVASGQTYGSRQEQVDAQRAIPLPAPAPPPAPTAQGTVTAGPLTPLSAPTQRPDEPLTAGLPMGAGPGPEALGPLGSPESDVVDILRGVYGAYPTEEIRGLIEQLQNQGQF